MPETTILSRRKISAEFGDGENRPSVRLIDVTKTYYLYESAHDKVMHSIGLDRFIPWRRHRTYHCFHALKELDLTVPRGARLGIVGRNGAGKTTLLKLITGNFQPTKGLVEVNGSVQALMQLGLGFHPDFSGYQNIRAALNYNGLIGKSFDDALEDVIDFVELGDFLHQPMKTYSLGMAARVQFAAATAIRPDIVIVDEVMGAGDAYFAGKSAHRMEKLTGYGCTLLLVSHSTAQVLQFCENAIWLEGGEIRMHDHAIDVVKAYEEYIEQLAWKNKRDSQTSMAAATLAVCRPRKDVEDYSTAEWELERMLPLLDTDCSPEVTGTSGSKISRWPGEQGLRIVRVEVLDSHGNIAHHILSGQPLDIEIGFVAQRTAAFPCRFAILIMTLDGVRLTRHLSQLMHFELSEGQVGSVRLRYSSTLLAAGEFVFSAAIFKHYDPNDEASAIRYDILSRSFRLQISPRHTSEPGYFHHPGEWVLPPYDVYAP